MRERIIKFTEALREGAQQMMSVDESIVILGLGVSYPNGADGTTAGIKASYPNRVFDVPVSENGFTGMAVGAAIAGLRPLVHHGRVEFAMLALDQVITQAAKWNYMFGGGHPVPLVIRIAVGRQWGNGPQHTQALYALFGSVPGLKVVIPSTPHMAKGLLTSALKDKNPVIILESRWLYPLKQHVPEKGLTEPLHKARVAKSGKDVTVVAYGDGFIASHEALNLIAGKVDAELIDLVSLNPIDYRTIATSIRKTGRLLCVDTTGDAFSIGTEIIGKMALEGIIPDTIPLSLATPNAPCPTSTNLTEAYYPTKIDVANTLLESFGKPKLTTKLSFAEIHLPPQLTLPPQS